MTYRIDTIKRMTAEEVFRRLTAIKKTYMNRNQALLYSSTVNHLSIDLCDEIDFYIRPIIFDDQQFMQYAAVHKQLFDASNFISTDIRSYVNSNVQLCKSFAMTAMLFTKYRKPEAREKQLIICIGSIYHAPRILYKDFSSGVVKYEKLASYLDLY